ncbi:unnamed protein product [Closterium sp. Yama58-4]|nr:unnamed protein product [Closterium sp. Yama58-4]
MPTAHHPDRERYSGIGFAQQPTQNAANLTVPSMQPPHTGAAANGILFGMPIGQHPDRERYSGVGFGHPPTQSAANLASPCGVGFAHPPTQSAANMASPSGVGFPHPSTQTAANMAFPSTLPRTATVVNSNGLGIPIAQNYERVQGSSVRFAQHANLGMPGPAAPRTAEPSHTQIDPRTSVTEANREEQERVTEPQGRNADVEDDDDDEDDTMPDLNLRRPGERTGDGAAGGVGGTPENEIRPHSIEIRPREAAELNEMLTGVERVQSLITDKAIADWMKLPASTGVSSKLHFVRNILRVLSPKTRKKYVAAIREFKRWFAHEVPHLLRDDFPEDAKMAHEDEVGYLLGMDRGAAWESAPDEDCLFHGPRITRWRLKMFITYCSTESPKQARMLARLNPKTPIRKRVACSVSMVKARFTALKTQCRAETVLLEGEDLTTNVDEVAVVVSLMMRQQYKKFKE